jgi:hypothetical protein
MEWEVAAEQPTVHDRFRSEFLAASGVVYEPDAEPGQKFQAPDGEPEPVGQSRCGACGRFVKKNGTCSLFLPVYRYGSYAGMEHR